MSIERTPPDGTPETNVLLQRMSALLEHTGQLGKVGGWELDLRSMKLSWTRETFTIAEIDPFVAPPLEEDIHLFAPDARPAILAALKAATEQGTPYDLELPIITGKGRHRWVRTQGYATMENGQAILLRGTFQDITERKRAEFFKNSEREVLEFIARGGPLPESLTRIVKCYESGFPGARGAMLLMDEAGQYLRYEGKHTIPAAYAEAVEKVVVSTGVSFCCTATHEKKTIVVADMAKDQRRFAFQHLALTHGIQACWVVPILGNEDRVLGTFAFYFSTPKEPTPADLKTLEGGAHLASLVIGREEAARARQRNADRLTLATRAAGVGIWEYDVKNNVLVWDEQMYRLYGVAEAQFTACYEAWLKALHPEDKVRAEQEIEQALRGKSEFDTEFRIVWPDGSTRHIRALSIVQRTAHGTPHRMIGTNWDITERKLAEVQTLQLERKMMETQKLESLGVLSGGIAHDFNNLLTGILGNASLASLDLPACSPVHDNLIAIKTGAMRAADLCRQMLAYAGKGRFHVTTLSLNHLIEESAQLMQLSISKHAVLRYKLDPSMPTFEADATQIRQVIMNLVINASEAIGKKSGVISISTGLTRIDATYSGGSLTAPELPPGTYVHLVVSDSGCGMDAKTQAKIYDPFFTTKSTGRGLGLAAVLGIVRSNKGVINVFSEVGRGTTFKLLFPYVSGPALEVTEPEKSTHTQGYGCILVVDDEATVRNTAAMMLGKLGFEVALTNNGREAVDIYRQQPDRFRLVLMDLTMPHLDGEQAFQELRAIKPDVKVILMSGFNEEESRLRFAGKGLSSFIQKPFDYELLNTKIQDALSR